MIGCVRPPAICPMLINISILHVHVCNWVECAIDFGTVILKHILYCCSDALGSDVCSTLYIHVSLYHHVTLIASIGIATLIRHWDSFYSLVPNLLHIYCKLWLRPIAVQSTTRHATYIKSRCYLILIVSAAESPSGQRKKSY